jgi:hypothetical protein
MVPMRMFPFAIGCGKTFIPKPSEKVPLAPTARPNCCTKAAFSRGL